MSPEVPPTCPFRLILLGAPSPLSPHLPGVRELLQLQLQLPCRCYRLTLPNLERLELLLQPGYIVLIRQRAVSLQRDTK